MNLTSALFFNLVHIFTSGMVSPSCEVNSTELHRQTPQVQIESVYDCWPKMQFLGFRQSKSHFITSINKQVCQQDNQDIKTHIGGPTKQKFVISVFVLEIDI